MAQYLLIAVIHLHLRLHLHSTLGYDNLRIACHAYLAEHIPCRTPLTRFLCKQPENQVTKLIWHILWCWRSHWGLYDLHDQSTLIPRLKRMPQRATLPYESIDLLVTSQSKHSRSNEWIVQAGLTDLIEQHTKSPTITLISVRLICTQLWTKVVRSSYNSLSKCCWSVEEFRYA